MQHVRSGLSRGEGSWQYLASCSPGSHLPFRQGHTAGSCSTCPQGSNNMYLQL